MAPAAPATARLAAVRPPAVAGTFYPADAGALRGRVEAWLREGAARLPAEVRDATVRAVIAPHAGYIYSGPIAGTAFAAVAGRRGQLQRVVNLGPSHRVAFDGLAAPGRHVTAFATPLGEVPLDRDALDAALQLPGVIELDEAHAREHALEAHLPFLQAALGRFRYVPLVFSETAPDVIARVIEALADDDTLIAISSDLSHYLSHDEASVLDRRTADAIERGDGDALGPDQACGRLAIQGLLQWTTGRGLRGHALDLRTSGDTAGPRDRVVGYGAFAFA